MNIEILITPTIGRVVWYKGHAGDCSGSDQMMAGIICYVHGVDRVNLCVMNKEGVSCGLVDVQLFHGDVKDCPIGACCWMPYQQKQAK